MKILSRFLQFIAVLMMALVVVALPFTLAARNLGRVVFNREAVLGLANENFLNPELLAAIGEQAVGAALATPEEDEAEGAAINRVMLAAFGNLSRAEWVRLMELIAPSAELSGLGDTVINGLYDWLEGDSAAPEFTLDLGPWKARMSGNALPMMEMILRALPPCDTAGTRTYQAEQDDLEAAASLPACRPPEPVYSELLNVGATVLPDRLAQTPDVVDFSQQMLGQPGVELARLKTDLLALRTLLRGVWLPVALLFFLALPLGVRSGRGLLMWAGWPLLLSGLALLVTGMGLLVFSEAMLTGVFDSGPLAELPRPLVASLRASGVAFISLIALPTLRQAFFLGGLGLLLVAAAAFLRRRALERQVAALSGVAPAMPSTASAAQPLPAENPPAAPPPAGAPPPAEDEPDDSKPTGMFG